MSKNSYHREKEDQLRDWDKVLDQLRERMSEANEELRAGYKARIDSLEKKRKAVRLKLDELKDETGDAWDDLQNGFEKAWAELKKGIDNALSHF